MRRHLLFLFALLPVTWCLAAPTPTVLQAVDLRWITGQPELETWLGSLQGTLNRQDRDTVVFLVRNGTDAAWAETLTRMYHLRKEVLTPGALLAAARPTLTGQVLYTATQPWTRNVALTAAAVAPGAVIATETDLGLPTVADLRNRWPDRKAAYAWAVEQYAGKANARLCLLAPESGHLQADLVAARQLLAVDLSPSDAAEMAQLRALLARFPAGSYVLGTPAAREAGPETATWALLALLRHGGQAFVPVQSTPNLSCVARFPVTRPLLQGRHEAPPNERPNELTLIYDGGSHTLDGSQSLDYAAGTLYRLMHDPALPGLPVGIEVPATLREFAPAMYQALLARQRMTDVEFIAAPNGDGWAQPMLMPEATAYLQRSAAQAKALDLLSLSLFDTGDKTAYEHTAMALTQQWHGIVVRPVAIEDLPDRQPRVDGVLPGCPILGAAARVGSVAELRAALAARKGPFTILYLDPAGLPPATLHALLPELSVDYLLVTPSQAFRAMEEYVAVMPWLAEQQRLRPNSPPKRGRATVRVSAPTTTLAAPTAGQPIPIDVRIDGTAAVLVARLIYQTPDACLGAADLRPAGNGTWSAVLPPMLVGGTLVVRARVVEQVGVGESISDPLELTLPGVDTDKDGLDDTLEDYLGSDPTRLDSDGDGLPDGSDAHPTRVDQDLQAYFAPITPPADRPFLVEAGLSTTETSGRTLPAGSTVTYRIPLKDIPATRAFLRVVASGPGSLTLNDGAAIPLETPDADLGMVDHSLAALAVTPELTVKITAGAKPLVLSSLSLISNPMGPYIPAVRLTPAYPPAGMPFAVQVTAYSPHGVRTVRLRYGTSLKTLASLELTPMEQGGQVVFGGVLPAQASASMLLCSAEAEDGQGHVTASPYFVTPIGRTRKHTVALLGARDLRGGWDVQPIWGQWGRTLTDTGTDTGHLLAHPGTYSVWLLAQPTERGVSVTIDRKEALSGGKVDVRLARATAAGLPGGWYKLGSFSVDESTRLRVSVAPIGDRGYCAYGMVVVTQDGQFSPPLTHAGLDWYNTLVVSGVSEGETVSGRITLSAAPTGNIDTVTVVANQLNGAIASGKTYPFAKGDDGRFRLETQGLPAGTYRITATGWRAFYRGTNSKEAALVTQTVTVNIAPRK